MGETGEASLCSSRDDDRWPCVVGGISSGGRRFSSGGGCNFSKKVQVATVVFNIGGEVTLLDSGLGRTLLCYCGTLPLPLPLTASTTTIPLQPPLHYHDE